MFYIGTGNTFITVDKNGKAIATMNFSDVKTFPTKQKASGFLVSLPRKLYDISNKWAIKEYNPSTSSKPSKPQTNKSSQTQTKSDKLLDVLYEQPDKNL